VPGLGIERAREGLIVNVVSGRPAPRSKARRSGLRRTAVVLPLAALLTQGLLQVAPVIAASVPVSATVGSVTIAPGANANVAIDVNVPTRPPAADILIAIDTTGSMGASIAQAKADATDIVNGVKASVADSQFAVVDFKDAVDGAAEYRVSHAMTGVAADVQTAINAMTAGGGGDAPEAHNLVLHNSYTPSTGGDIGWRSGTKKIVVIISDAQPHGAGSAGQGLTGCSDTAADPHGLSTATELAGLAGADRTLFMIRQAATASTTLQCYQSIVARTPGGVAVNSGTALGAQIVSLLDSSFTAAVADLHLQLVSAAPAVATSWISLTPSSRSAVPTPSTQTFSANVSVPSGATAGAYTFDIAWIADGANIGHTTLTTTVASALGVPNLSQAVPQADHTLVAGVLKATPSTTFHLRFVTSASCTDGVIGSDAVTFATADAVTNATGDAYFGGSVLNTATLATYVAAQVVPPGGSSEVGPCIVASADNDQWPRALDISGAASTNGFVDVSGRARWYKFSVQPGSHVTVNLSSLPADYDLYLFKDIGQAYTSLTDTASLTKLSAEFAPSAFSPSAFSPSAFSPSAFSPSAFSPSAFSPSAFSPSAFSPSAFSPSAFSPSAFSPSAFSPSAFSPSAFSPSAFSPSAFSPSAFSPSGFSPSAFSGAQTRSLIGVSASNGTASERLVADTWNNTGSFYVRVSGKNGESSLSDSFSVSVTSTGNQCASSVTPIGSPPTPADLGLSSGGNRSSLILWDSSRTTGDTTTLAAKLALLAARPEVAGAIVDLASNTRIQSLNAQADAAANIPCMYAKNLVAAGIKDIVNAYRSANPNLKYIVLVGGDATIPFFRYPDQTLLGEEQDYDAPVGLPTPSKASLGANFVLGQDAYGASTELSLRASSFPVPDLAVGRLVETAGEASGLIDAYLATSGGVVATPTTSLVTGYDFLEDAANSVKSDLNLGIGAVGDSLITHSTVAPGTLCSATVLLPDCSWDATALNTQLLGARHDLIFLGGHFSANNALAADFATTLNATDLANAPSTLDLTNSIIFSAGCHSGYNIVDADATSATAAIDWSQAVAQRKATLIAGTGYQYGDTDFVEYSERIYAEFAHQLRVGSGPVSIGQALMRAKQIYLASTPDIRGLHEKALLESTIFGLPMLSINMPGTRDPLPSTSSIVSATPAGFATNPGLGLGLKSADVTLNPATTANIVNLTKIDGSVEPPAIVGTVTATYYRGRDGVVTNPGEPALPLQSENVSVAGQVLRGVGFRSGTYTDSTVVPLTGAAATEIRGIHNAFSSTVFYPMRPWTVDYYDALATGAGGPTRLLVTPAQHKVGSIGDQTATLRRYSGLGLRLYYSSYVGDAAQSDAPTITGIQATVTGSSVAFRAHVTGNPSAGIQQVWITHNGTPNTWQSIDLSQSATDSTLWTGTLALTGGTSSGNLRFMVQAVNGVGLVAMDDNLGAYHTVTPDSSRPTISAAIATGLTGSNGWYTSPVTVRYTCHDGTGFGIGATACPGDETLASEGSAVESTPRTVTDNAGFVSAFSNVITVKVDRTRPMITAVATGTVSTHGWYRSNVTVHFTCADPGGSGIPLGACPADQVLSDEESAISTTAQMVSDNAGNTSAPTNVVTYKIDKTNPTVSLAGGPANSSSSYFGSVPPAPTCVGADGLSGLDTCTVSGYSTAVGPHTVTATATDNAGNSTTTAPVTYTVVAWTMLGFYQPTDMNGIVNTVKNGSTVPLKFEVFIGPTELTNTSAVLQPLRAIVSNCSGAPTDDIELLATGGTSLRYDTTAGQFIYNWQTPKTVGTCYLVTVTAADGSTLQANFKLK
jgi:hypothetical protein